MTVPVFRVRYLRYFGTIQLRILVLNYSIVAIGPCSAFANWKLKNWWLVVAYYKGATNTVAPWSLRNLQMRKPFTAAFASEEWCMTIKKKKKKMFIPHLAIVSDFFHSAFVNPCIMYNQRRSQSAVRLTAPLAIECLMANYCTRWRPWVKGPSLDGGRANFAKIPTRRFL